MAPAAVHWIELDGAANARAVVPGVLLRTDNLQSLTDADIALLIDEHRLGTVIDLRSDGEVASEGDGPLVADSRVSIEHHSLYPAAEDSDDPDASVINPWLAGHGDAYGEENPAVATYMSYLVRRPDSVLAAIRAIARSDHAVLVHCAAGKDRTGTIVAVALDAVGVDRGEILEDYLVTTERIEAIAARLRGSDTYREGLEGQRTQDLAPRRSTMERVLELLDEEYGGSEGYLRRHGLTDAEHAALVRRLVG